MFGKKKTPLVKYHINGTEKETPTDCKICENGEKLTKERVYDTDSLGADVSEHICEECYTKYKVPKIIPEFEIDTEYGVKITDWDIEHFDENQMLVPETLPFFAILFSEKIKEGKKKMNWNKVEEARKMYSTMGLCPEHIWINSNPFLTPEGKFVIKNCLVCRTAFVNYKGREYNDEIFRLLGFLSDRGIAYDKKQKAEEIEFGKLLGTPKNEEFNLFSDEEISALLAPIDVPNFDIEELPNFDLDDELPKF